MKSEILNNLLIILTDFTIKVIHSNGTTPRSKYEKKPGLMSFIPQYSHGMKRVSFVIDFLWFR